MGNHYIFGLLSIMSVLVLALLCYPPLNAQAAFSTVRMSAESNTIITYTTTTYMTTGPAGTLTTTAYQVPLPEIKVSVTPDRRTMPPGVLAGMEAATVRVEVSYPWSVWQAGGLEVCVPVSLSVSGVPSGVHVSFNPDPLMLCAHLEEFPVVGSGESKMGIVTEYSAMSGTYDLEIIATCTVQGVEVFRKSCIFHLTIQPGIPGFPPVSIILGAVAAMIITLIIHRIKKERVT